MKAHKMVWKWIGCGLAFWASLETVQGTIIQSWSATSGPMTIDTRANDNVITFGRYWPDQEVCYSGYAWDTRLSNETAEVTADGVALVKSAGEGQVMWRPARVGLHTLQHTVHGITLTRTYDAEGPTVRIVCTQPFGEEGVFLCQIDCDMPGATVHYTMDGTEPTAASTVYIGPFRALPAEVERLMAVAVMDGYPMSQTAKPIIYSIEPVVSSETSGKMVIDTRAGKGSIATDHAEDITYSNLWDGETNAMATVTLDGATLVDSAATEGVYRWEPVKGGTYVFTHTTLKAGRSVGKTLTATFVVPSHDIPIGSITVNGYSGVYDGLGHGIDVQVTSIANSEIKYAYAKTGPYVESLRVTNVCEATPVWYTVAADGYNTCTNWATVTIAPRPVTVTSRNLAKVYDGTPLRLTADDITADNLVAGESFVYGDLAERTTVGETSATFRVAAGPNTRLENYEVETTFGMLSVTKATVAPGGGGGSEPGTGELPEGAVSKFDGASVYDGAGHTLETNALVSAFTEAMGGPVDVSYATDAEPNESTVWLAAAPAFTNAGVYKVWYKVANPNYEDFTHAAQVTIAPRPATVTSRNRTKVYDGTPLKLAASDITADNLVAGEAFVYGDLAERTAVGETSATFRVAAGTNTRLENYEVETAFGTLSVTKATVAPGGGSGSEPGTGELPEGAVSKFDGASVYDGAGHTLVTNALVSAFTEAMGGPVDVSYATDAEPNESTAWLAAAPAFTNAGVYKVWYKVANPNYEDFTHAAQVTIAPRPATVTSRNRTKVYDGTPLKLTADDITADNLVAGEAFVYGDLAERTDVGETSATFTVAAGPNTRLENYEVATEFGTLTVTKASVGPGGGGGSEPGTGELPEGAVSKFDGAAVYDGAGHTLETNALVSAFTEAMGGPVDVSYTADAEPDESTVWLAAAPAFTNAGVYKVWYKVANPNYEDFTHESEVTIAPRPATVTSRNRTKVYDGTPLKLTASDIIAENLVAGEAFAYGDLAERTAVGETSATFTVAAGPNTRLENYEVETTFGTLSVTKASVGPGGGGGSEPGTGELPEGAASKFDGTSVYDGAGHTLVTNALVAAFTEAMGGPVDVSYATDAEPNESTVWLAEAPAFTNAGTYAVRYRVTNPNYEDFTHAAQVTIAKRPVTVTSGNSSKVYDGTPLKLTASDITAENLVEGESFVYGDLAERTTVGETSATFRVAAGSNTRLENYEVETTFGMLSVTKATVAPGGGGGSEPGTGELPEGAVSKFDGTAVYDGAGHTLATNALVAAFTEAMGGPVDVSYATDAEPNESTVWLAAAPAFTNAGVYKVWYKVANPNYEDFTHAAQVTIAPRPATVTSRNRTKVYDGTPLKLAASDITADNLVAGEAFVYGDLAERTDVGETEATFTVVAGEGTMLANYAITTSFGTLSVTKATYPGQEPGGAGIAWSVASDGADWMYDGQAHGVTLTGVPAGVEAHLAGNTATDAGSYTATVTFSYDTKNYEPPVAPDPIHWTISPRPITLMAAAKEKPYDGFPLTVKPGDITASGSGYATGECFEYFDFASITDVGETAATFSYRDSATAKVSNYAVTVKGGQTLRVTVGGDQISVTADSGTWAYDGAEHCAASWRVENGDKLLAGHELRVAIDPASVVRTPEDGPDGDGVVSNRFASVRIVEAATGADRTRNYTLVLKEGVLKMTNACIRAENLAGTVDIRKVYDGVATQAVVSATLLRPATVRYATGDTLPADGWSAKPTAFVHAGTQTVWYAVEAQYHDPYTNSLDVAILPRPVTLTTPTKSKTYDGAPLSFGTDEVEVGGEGYVQDESFAFSDFASISDAGRIAATCAYEAGAGTRLSDYAIAENWGTLTVLASADEIAVTAGSATWPYDGTEHRLATYTAENADKLQPGDELVVEFAPESVALTPEDGPNRDGVVSNAIVSVRVVRNGTEDVTRNYSLAWYPGVLRVTKAQVTFAGEGSADPSGFAATATYDGQGHAAAVVPPVLLTSPVAVRYGRAADDVASDVSPAFTNAGVHTVFYTIDAPYYETYAGTTTVTITPRPVTLVSGGAEKIYDGTPLRVDSVRVKAGSPGFVAGEGFTAICSGAQTDVGAMENLFDYTLTDGTHADNYEVKKEYGWLRVTPATLDPGAVFGGGETDAEGDPVCARVYNGAPQPFALAPNFGEPYRLYYALVPGDESAYSETSPTRTHVAEGDLAVYFKFLSSNYAPYYGKGILRITPKELTPELVVADEEAAWIFDGTEKKPAVTVVDGNPNIATTNDYTVAYSDRTGAGLFPVTVTGRNDYSGTVTKEFAILKRPVAPPVIGALSYNGHVRRPSIPADERWTVVANPGGTDAGAYTNIVLRLTAPADYKWKGQAEDETDWTGVFIIKPGPNGWSRAPGLASWTAGETPSVPDFGMPRNGTVSEVFYRARGAAIETATTNRPARAGLYTARFVVAATRNYAGTWRDVDFEIRPGSGATATSTTPVPVPYAWLDAYRGAFGGDYETAAHATGKNGVALWASYVAGLDPLDAASRFRAFIALEKDGTPQITWSPDLRTAQPPRVYTVYGKPTLDAADWAPVTDENRGKMRFFKVTVEIEGFND